LLKACALPVHCRPEDQREDVIALLALVDDPDAMRRSLTQAERRCLRSTESTLALDDPALPARFSLARLRAARAAYQIPVAWQPPGETRAPQPNSCLALSANGLALFHA
jgi:hypothetical protein